MKNLLNRKVRKKLQRKKENRIIFDSYNKKLYYRIFIKIQIIRNDYERNKMVSRSHEKCLRRYRR